MSNLPESWPSPGGKNRRSISITGQLGRAGRSHSNVWPRIWGWIFVVGLIGGGIYFLAQAPARIDDAVRLAAAPICASGQQVGCRLEEQVTVLNLQTESCARCSPAYDVEVRTPDGSTIYAQGVDHDFWSRLWVDEQLNAELWNGNIIRLDDGTGHSGVSDSPDLQAWVFPLVGAVELILGGILLYYLVRSLLRQKRARG